MLFIRAFSSTSQPLFSVFLLLLAALLPACSEGVFQEDDRIWIDLEVPYVGDDGYLSGFYLEQDDDEAVIKVQDVFGAEDHELAIKARHVHGGQIRVPHTMLRSYDQGYQSWKARKEVEELLLSIFSEEEWRKNLQEEIQAIKIKPGAGNLKNVDALDYIEGLAEIYQNEPMATELLPPIELHTKVFRYNASLYGKDPEAFAYTYRLLSDVFLKYFLKQHRLIAQVKAKHLELKKLRFMKADAEMIAAKQKELDELKSRLLVQRGLLRADLQEGILRGEIGSAYSVRDRMLALVSVLNMFEMNNDKHYSVVIASMANPETPQELKLQLLQAMLERSRAMANLLTKNGSIDLAEGQGKERLISTTVNPLIMPFKEAVEIEMGIQHAKNKEDVQRIFNKAQRATHEYSEQLNYELYTDDDLERMAQILKVRT